MSRSNFLLYLEWHDTTGTAMQERESAANVASPMEGNAIAGQPFPSPYPHSYRLGFSLLLIFPIIILLVTFYIKKVLPLSVGFTPLLIFSAKSLINVNDLPSLIS